MKTIHLWARMLLKSFWIIEPDHKIRNDCCKRVTCSSYTLRAWDLLQIIRIVCILTLTLGNSPFLPPLCYTSGWMVQIELEGVCTYLYSLITCWNRMRFTVFVSVCLPLLGFTRGILSKTPGYRCRTFIHNYIY